MNRHRVRRSLCVLRTLLTLGCLGGGLVGCQWQARGVETVVSIRAAAGSMTSEELATKACLYITGLTNYHTIVTLVLAHDSATLAECLTMTPPGVPGLVVPRLP